MLRTDSGNLNLQVLDAAIREWKLAVFVALAQLPSVEIDVLHPYAAAFEQPQSGAIGQLDHQPVDSADPFDVLDQARNFLLGKDSRQTAALLRAESVNVGSSNSSTVCRGIE